MRDINEQQLAELTEWIRSRPPAVQEMAVRFPPACTVRTKPDVYLIHPGKGETGQVSVYRENETGVYLLVRCVLEVGSIQWEMLRAVVTARGEPFDDDKPACIEAACDPDALEVVEFAKVTSADIAGLLAQ